ncbi:hypothetical protein AcV5_001375 [Taiwanofungus camphoratus]|nr:hypothetical protein AcV5_001375 [Antrodia cinnamomea]
MALNWTMLSPARSPIPLPDELTIRTLNSGVELTLLVPDAPPSGSSSSGGSGGTKKMKEMGRLWLTDQRLIFITDCKDDGPSINTPKDPPTKPSSNSSFESLTVPLTSLLSTKFEQPLLGQNYLVIEIQPAPGGSLTAGTKAEVRLKDKGLFEFVSALEKTRERTIYMKRQAADDDEGLPVYTSGDVGPSYASRIPDDAPPSYDA